LRELTQIDGLRWIRLLYSYPRYVTDELLDTIAAEPKICSYIDMPLQHVSDRMLRAMRRERDGSAIRSLLGRIRERIPDVAVRTAFIVGFPGETEADFEELLEFVRAARFDRCGVFPYSREEDTEAATMSGQVSAAVRHRRYDTLMRAQAEIAAELNRKQIGRDHTVLVCGEDEKGRNYGRLASQAPEIDGVVYLDRPALIGSMQKVHITGATTYDLKGEVRYGNG